MKVAQSCPTLCDPMDYTVHRILQARILEWVAVPFSRGSSHNPGIEPKSLPAEPPGKSKITGVGSLSLLQRIFPTQGSNPGLPHCRLILYQLSHKGSPMWKQENERMARTNEWMNFILPELILTSRQQWGDHCTSSSGLHLVLNWSAGCPTLPAHGL